MEKYTVTGMSCAACVSRVEKAVLGVEGVVSCQVNLLTNSMNVEGIYNNEEIINAVEKAGYRAIPEGAGKERASKSDDALEDKETPKLRRRLIASLGFLILLMYVSMGHLMWGFPLPKFFEGNYVAIAVLEMVLSATVLVINQKFFISGTKALIHGSPNMDTLVALGSGVSFAYSLVQLFLMTDSDSQTAHSLLHDLYFEASAMILALITVGKMLEAFSKGKTTSALRELMALQPKTATVLKDGKEKEISIDDLREGDLFVVKVGGGIPVDGIIVEGEASIDEASLTGESIPSDKGVNDKVYAGTTTHSGYIVCQATTDSDGTVLSEIIKTVGDSASSKAPIARVADKVSGVFVPVVISIAIVTIVIWLLLGKEIGFALARGISVLVISCPCALGLATPVAIMVGNGVGAKNGVLFKNATALENTGKAKIVVLDKTGTITKGEPVVTDVIPFNLEENELISLAYSLEFKSQHPLAKAIVKEAEKRETQLLPSSNFEALARGGVRCEINGFNLLGGSFALVSSKIAMPTEAKTHYEALSQEGKTPLFFAKNDSLIGIIAVRDEIKEDSRKAIGILKKMGIKVVMLTGDNEKSAEAIAKQVLIDKVVANVMPSDKERVIRELKSQGSTVMVGDGINDAPALVSADIGMAIGQGTQIAVDSAEVVLVKNSLMDVVNAIRLSKATLRNIHQNLFWAFVYNTLGIPIAAGVFISLFGWQLNPMLGAFAMSLSSFCVVTNALRLNLIKLEKENNKMLFKKKEKANSVVLSVEGMMCPHCEARVKKAVEEIEGVSEAIPSHKKNSVTVIGDCDIEKVKAVIAEQGYTVK